MNEVDAFRQQVVSRGGGKSPKAYFDKLQIEQTGDPIEYRIEPLLGTWYHVEKIKIVMADVYDATLTGASMPNLSFNKLLGETLAAGFIYRVSSDTADVSFNTTIRSLGALLRFPDARIEDVICDGTNTFLTVVIDLNYPIVLKSESLDHISITISEDLTGFIGFRANVVGFVEQR